MLEQCWVKLLLGVLSCSGVANRFLELYPLHTSMLATICDNATFQLVRAAMNDEMNVFRFIGIAV